MTVAKSDQAHAQHRAQRKPVTYANTYYNKLTVQQFHEKPINTPLTPFLQCVTCFHTFTHLTCAALILQQDM
jgi:DNA-directed RNA polymerase subunit M/transcription elongation factor TFIIS